MTNISSNKEVVSAMYQTFLNQKQLDSLDQFVDADYIDEFKAVNRALMLAFRDIHFSIKEIFEDGDKVVTVYEWSGTHQNDYQKIPATNKRVIVDGISIYELKNGKIINSIAKPNKLSFFIQLGIIPEDFLSRVK
ncbi:ester cyclase [Sinomicrobium sp.]